MLYTLTEKARALYEKLNDAEMELPEEELNQIFKDTMEANGETYLVDRTVEMIRNFEADAKSAKDEKDFFYKKQKTAENAADRLKNELLSYLLISKQKQIKGDKFTVTKSQSQAVFIADENSISQNYLIEQAPKIDKKKIREDLKAGKEVAGAMLQTNESVRIK